MKIFENFSSNSLFAIPANQEFVFVNNHNTNARDILSYMSLEFIKSCTVSPGANSKSLNHMDSLLNNNDSDNGEISQNNSLIFFIFSLTNFFF